MSASSGLRTAALWLRRSRWCGKSVPPFIPKEILFNKNKFSVGAKQGNLVVYKRQEKL